MARVKCVMMQRDEKLLLEAWFRYYGYLFGFENLVVFDNGSVDEDVIRTLKAYERVGCTVLWEHRRVEDFHAKGSHFRNVVLQWDWKGDYDFALPLDCDEFLAVFTRDGLSCRREEIHRHFDELIGTDQALAFGLSLYNVPTAPGVFSPTVYPKSFLSANTVEDIDHGFHAAKSKKQPGHKQTRFTYLHMHNKPFGLLREHAIRKLEMFTDTSDLNSLRLYKGPGLHLVRYFFMTEEEYTRQFDSKLLISMPGFGHLMYSLGVRERYFGTADFTAEGDNEQVIKVLSPSVGPDNKRVARAFVGEQYLRLHSDVAASTDTPLIHYLFDGYREQRSLN